MTRSAGTGPDAALRRIAECRLVVVIRLPTTADALQVGRILLAAGVEVLEVTGTTPGPVTCWPRYASRRNLGCFSGLARSAQSRMPGEPMMQTRISWCRQVARPP